MFNCAAPAKSETKPSSRGIERDEDFMVVVRRDVERAPVFPAHAACTRCLVAVGMAVQAAVTSQRQRPVLDPGMIEVWFLTEFTGPRTRSCNNANVYSHSRASEPSGIEAWKSFDGD